MFKAFQQHFHKEFKPFLNQRILIAVSAGVDSVILCHLLHKLKIDIGLAHCNFKLRANESEQDEMLVKSLANELNCPFYSTSFDTVKEAKLAKDSIQMTARRLRYEWFENISEKDNWDCIATAHHLNDDLETFFINLSRGSGLEGLKGIKSQNGKIIRPLLQFQKSEIYQYAINEKLKWREDASNRSNKYQRNWIRNELIPQIMDQFPHFMKAYSESQKYLNYSHNFIQEQIGNLKADWVQKIDNDAYSIDIKFLQNKAAPTFLYEWLKDYGFSAWDDILSFYHAQTGKQIFSNNYRLIKNRTEIMLSPLKQDEEEIWIKETLDTPAQCPIKFDDSNNQDHITVDAEKIVFPIVVRKWKNGDYIYPIGMSGKKKVSKYFKDNRFSLLQKEASWLLVNGNNELIWIVGQRADRRYCCNKNTKKKLKIYLNEV